MTAAPPSNSSSAVVQPTIGQSTRSTEATVALLGNPNAGKTTLFNRLTGLRAKTANFPGTTLEVRRGAADLEHHRVTLLDLPGLYSLGSMNSANPEEAVAADTLRGDAPGVDRPAAAVLVIDATSVARHLYLVSQVRETDVPVVVALNMIDAAERSGLSIDADALSLQLGAPVVPVSARNGRGIVQLRREIEKIVADDERVTAPVPEPLAACSRCGGCPHAARHAWASGVAADSVKGLSAAAQRWSDRFDTVLTHPAAGLGVFAAIMAGLFVLIFSTAAIPMDLIDAGFAALGGWAESVLPDNDFRSFLIDGVIGGVGGVLVFLPQICILFFILTLLEDTGYLARAALVMDRLMSKVGLPGKAFVPMLSAHACAIPAIMSTRVIENKRDRLVSILVIPLLTCSARLPVYAMVTALLFAGRPVLGGLVFFGAYALGIVAALVIAFLLKLTLLPGKARPLVIELPDFRMPSLRVALLTTLDRGLIFIKRAGTIILLISMGLWVLSTYPKLPAERLGEVATPADAAQARALETQIAGAEAAGDTQTAATLGEELSLISGKYEVAHSFAGRLGRAVEPVFAPLGFDWQINVGVISSFAAREVVVSTLAIVYGLGEDAAEEPLTLSQTLAAQTHADGTPVFTLATSLSLLVFFVLAMQCLPTQAVARRETGGWKWPLFQLGYMTVLAYGAAWVTYTVASAFT
ncbi:MAG: ferrous iron transporter B [Planctomycetota bacterium]